MRAWLILPRDPLIFRDGRPFNATPGARARSLPFPYPATIAGAVRTRAGRNECGRFDSTRIPELLQKQVIGPVLVQVDGEGVKAWFLPAPADSLLIQERSAPVQRVWLCPVELPQNVVISMPDGLRPVGPTRDIKTKPWFGAPAFWSWEMLKTWLECPEEGEVNPRVLGIPSLPIETRTHVHIDHNTGTAQEGFLFQTSGLRFLQKQEKEHIGETRPLGLLVWTEADLQESVDYLGGERRLVYWKAVDIPLPSCPDAIREAVKQKGALRLMLATPAWFKKGFLPSWLNTLVPDLQVKVVAVALTRRAQVISGWDLKEHCEKPSRRLVPAGTVYFLYLEGSEEARVQFVQRIWFQPISDDDQMRLDGFGLALLGAWDGQIHSWEVSYA